MGSGSVYLSDGLKKELNKFRNVAPIKKGRRGPARLYFSDIIWFLVDERKKLQRGEHVFTEITE